VLYKGGTPAARQRTAIPGEGRTDRGPLIRSRRNLHEGRGHGFRRRSSAFFPSSKLKDGPEDDDIVSLNRHMLDDFGAAANPATKRRNYRLVGAIWLDKPGTHLCGQPEIRSTPAGRRTRRRRSNRWWERTAFPAWRWKSFTQDSFANCFSLSRYPPGQGTTGSSCWAAKKLKRQPHLLEIRRRIQMSAGKGELMGFQRIKGKFSTRVWRHGSSRNGNPDLSGHGQTFSWATQGGPARGKWVTTSD